MKRQHLIGTIITIVALAQVGGKLSAQSDCCANGEQDRLLFTKERFGGNGRTCQTCHSPETGTLSPSDVFNVFSRNNRDPLFLTDGSDDGSGHGVSRILRDATILITLPLPQNVRLASNPSAGSITVRRGIPTTLNTPALDPVLMLDGREPNLIAQALHAVQTHGAAPRLPTLGELLGIARFQQTDRFFSSPVLRCFAGGGAAPVLPPGKTAAEKRGRVFFADAPFVPGSKAGSCAFCHSGPLLNETNKYFTDATGGLVPAGTRFQSIGVSEFNASLNPVFQLVWTNANGMQSLISTPDPGRALITGRIDQPGPLSDLNSFKIPTLWGVKNTAPYFHDNSAKTLEDMAAHYARFLATLQDPVILSKQDQSDMVAYIKLLD